MRFVEMSGLLAGSLTVVGAPAPAPEYADGRKTGRQRRDALGVPLWSVPCLYQPTDAGEIPEIVRVRVASEEQPAIPMRARLLGDVVSVTPWVNSGRIAYALTVPCDAFKARRQASE